jgi:putative acetyltransferase
MRIVVDDLSGPEIAALIGEHLRDMHLQSPPESIHALGLEKLRQPNVTVWSAWEGDELVGCGALKELDPSHGEIKSMRTARAHRRKGVAAAMLRHLLDEAKRRGYARVSLETGSMASFEPARQLYARHGFTLCGPFADYRLDANSTFMTRTL